MTDDVRISVVSSCYNQEMKIAKVVSDFRAAIPNARIYVYDNNSTDQSAGPAQDGWVGASPSSAHKAAEIDDIKP